MLRAHVAAFDPSAPVAGWGPDPAVLGNALADGLARQGVAPGSIDAVIAGAGGSRAGDAAEGGILRHVFGDRLPVVFAPNAYAGQHAAIPLAFACWLLDGGVPAPTPHFEQVDPKLDIRPWAGGELPSLRRLLISALAVGGAASFVVLDAWAAADGAGVAP
jgi:3-oxoacyl-(acyl-carrier-protein) synthase